MMCRVRLMRRLPARESRWRCCWPQDASRGAVPLQEVNRSRLAKRWMSPTSASNRAAPDGPMPCSSGRVQPRAVTSSVRSLSMALIFWSIPSSSPISSTTSRRRVVVDDVAWLDRGDQGAGLGGGEESLGATGKQLRVRGHLQVHLSRGHSAALAAELPATARASLLDKNTTTAWAPTPRPRAHRFT